MSAFRKVKSMPMDWQQWQSVAFTDRKQLPTTAGIYIIADANHFVWYVGQATNLRSRWQGRTHHRYAQLIRTNKKLAHRIYWQPFLVGELDEKERFYIAQLRPELNGCKVKTYLPKQPQVEREIRRLLKVLNRPTLLFPVIRSAIAGEYRDLNDTRCIVLLVQTNDCLLLGRSGRKKYAAEVRRAWDGFECQCNQPSEHFAPLFVNTYTVGRLRVEFLDGSEILSHLEDHPKTYSQFVGTGELLGVEVAVLLELSILQLLPMADAFNHLRRGNRQMLRDVAYLRYRRPMLQPLQSKRVAGLD